MKSVPPNPLDPILARALQGGAPDRAEMDLILSLEAPRDHAALFGAARTLRERHFGRRVYLYGFLYISTHCRNHCTFCYYRAPNRRPHRYRKTEAEILDAARQLAESGVHLIDLTLSEDPHFYGPGHFAPLVDLVKQISTLTGKALMVSPGVVPCPVVGRLARAGADWLACYQETHNPGRFAQLRPGQDYQQRMDLKATALDCGLRVEEGILVGMGEGNDDIIDSLGAMKTLGADQVRAMRFVPRRGTPLEKHPPASAPARELLTLALMRLVFPRALIPATLDVDGLAGLGARLHAGANVVTSIVPPGRGLEGVARSHLDIDAAGRTVESVLPVLESHGLHPAPPGAVAELRTRRKSNKKA